MFLRVSDIYKFLILISLALLDVLFTIYLLNTGRYVESNPIIKAIYQNFGWATVGIIKVGVYSLIGIWLIRKHNTKREWGIVLSLAAVPITLSLLSTLS